MAWDKAPWTQRSRSGDHLGRVWGEAFLVNHASLGQVAPALPAHGVWILSVVTLMTSIYHFLEKHSKTKLSSFQLRGSRTGSIFSF